MEKQNIALVMTCKRVFLPYPYITHGHVAQMPNTLMLWIVTTADSDCLCRIALIYELSTS